MKKILIVEDNLIIQKGLEYALTNEKYLVTLSNTIEQAKKILYKNSFDLVLLDISLPDGDGFELCKQIKESMTIPVIILTAKETEDDVVKGFSLGADDYVIKPFRMRELISRIDRCTKKIQKNSIINGLIKIDLDSNRVFSKENEIILTALEYKILVYLYHNLDKIITREMLLSKIWDDAGNFVNDNTLTVYIKRIREKLNTTDIETIKGIGYRVHKYE